MAKKKQDNRYLQNRDGVFYFRKDKMKRSLGTTDPDVALHLRDTYLANLAEYGQLDPPVVPVVEIPTFGKVAKDWAEIHRGNVRHSTWRDYVSAMNRHILPVFKDVPITDITYSDVLKFRNALKVGAKRANNILVPMKAVFDFADQEGLIQGNVMRKVKRKEEEATEIHPFTHEEVMRVLDAIDPWYKPYACVGFFTGMRAGELNGLEWRDFLEGMKPKPQIFIRKTYVYKREGAPKTKKSKRYIDCFPQVIDALIEQRKMTGKGKHIFLTRDGRRMTPDHFRKEVWTPALVKAGLDYRPPIQTRHTFATMMITAREDVGWVQNMLGHSSLQMIYQRYYAWMPKDTRRDGEAFLRSIEGTTDKGPGEPQQTAVGGAENDENVEERPNVVPLARYRQRKRAHG